MGIEVKTFATLAKHQPGDGANYPIEPGDTPADVIRRLGIPADAVKIILINGRSAQPDAKLKEGDRLGLFPAVGGG